MKERFSDLGESVPVTVVDCTACDENGCYWTPFGRYDLCPVCNGDKHFGLVGHFDTDKMLAESRALMKNPATCPHKDIDDSVAGDYRCKQCDERWAWDPR